jgi:hypothetical protein
MRSSKWTRGLLESRAVNGCPELVGFRYLEEQKGTTFDKPKCVSQVIFALLQGSRFQLHRVYQKILSLILV